MNDAQLPDAETLRRRVFPGHLKEDNSISSAAFTDDEMSVDRAKLRSVDESLSEHPGYGLAEFEAGFARGLGQSVEADPKVLNLAHALVRGKKSRSVRRLFAQQSRWARMPLRATTGPADEDQLSPSSPV